VEPSNSAANVVAGNPAQNNAAALRLLDGYIHGKTSLNDVVQAGHSNPAARAVAVCLAMDEVSRRSAQEPSSPFTIGSLIPRHYGKGDEFDSSAQLRDSFSRLGAAELYRIADIQANRIDRMNERNVPAAEPFRALADQYLDGRNMRRSEVPDAPVVASGKPALDSVSPGTDGAAPAWLAALTPDQLKKLVNEQQDTTKYSSTLVDAAVERLATITPMSGTVAPAEKQLERRPEGPAM
jgi:hypothetical protein